MGGEWSLETVMKWMTNKKSWKNRPQSKMFMKLFRYIAGVNKESQEIEMTVPVWSKMVVNEEDGKITKDMCFYITKEFQSNPPEPTDPEEQGEGRLRQAVWRLRHAGLRVDERGGEVPGGIERQDKRGGPQQLLDRWLRQSYEVLEQKERGGFPENKCC